MKKKFRAASILCAAGVIALFGAQAEAATESQDATRPTKDERQAPSERLAPGEHLAPLADVKISYRVAGHGPVLVVPGYPWGFGTVQLRSPGGISPLERHFTLIYVDTPGVGDSTRPADPAKMGASALVDDFEQLREYLGLPTIYLFGHSAGGGIALGYAERYPERVKKLLLVDSTVLDIRPSPRTAEIVNERLKDPRYAAAAASWNGSHDGTRVYADTDDGATQALIDILNLYFYDPKKYRPVFEQTLGETKIVRWVQRSYDKAQQVTILPESKELSRITADTLVLEGRADFICPLDMAEVIAAGVPRSKLVIFERTGHMPWIEERPKFFKVVEKFLRE
jgi:proline iminopeptidase